MNGTRARIYKWKILDGKHAGHNVTTDAFAVDIMGADPDTEVYCHDCRESFEATQVTEEEAQQDAAPR